MNNEELRASIIEYLNQIQQENMKQVSTVDVYRSIVNEYPDVSFSTIDGLLIEIAKVYSLPNSKVYTKFTTGGNEYEEYVLVFLNGNLSE
ncbi:MAG: hypothetical protein IJG07_10785 [Prevotella sp.]|nr:hypothetical protein [Prevotella sp.]